MSKTRFLSLIVIALILLNIGIITVLVLNMRSSEPQQHLPRHEGPKYIIIEKLQFDEGQEAQYQKLIDKHRADIRAQEFEMRSAKNELYGLLQGEDHQLRDSLVNAIGQIHKEIEHIHYAHFNDIKKLCREDQLVYFNELTEELSRLFAPPPPMSKPPPKHAH